MTLDVFFFLVFLARNNKFYTGDIYRLCGKKEIGPVFGDSIVFWYDNNRWANK